MQIHQLKPVHKRKKPKRVGRGGKHGTYSGRGIKGQKARAGRNLKPSIRDWIKRYPKLRGYKFQAPKQNAAIVKLAVIGKKYGENETVSPQTLISKGIIKAFKNKAPKVKILAQGAFKKKLAIENCRLSKAARQAVEKAGGTIK